MVDDYTPLTRKRGGFLNTTDTYKTRMNDLREYLRTHLMTWLQEDGSPSKVVSKGVSYPEGKQTFIDAFISDILPEFDTARAKESKMGLPQILSLYKADKWENSFSKAFSSRSWTKNFYKKNVDLMWREEGLAKNKQDERKRNIILLFDKWMTSPKVIPLKMTPRNESLHKPQQIKTLDTLPGQKSSEANLLWNYSSGTTDISLTQAKDEWYKYFKFEQYPWEKRLKIAQDWFRKADTKKDYIATALSLRLTIDAKANPDCAQDIEQLKDSENLSLYPINLLSDGANASWKKYGGTFDKWLEALNNDGDLMEDQKTFLNSVKKIEDFDTLTNTIEHSVKDNIFDTATNGSVSDQKDKIKTDAQKQLSGNNTQEDIAEIVRLLKPTTDTSIQSDKQKIEKKLVDISVRNLHALSVENRILNPGFDTLFINEASVDVSDIESLTKKQLAICKRVTSEAVERLNAAAIKANRDCFQNEALLKVPDVEKILTEQLAKLDVSKNLTDVWKFIKGGKDQTPLKVNNVVTYIPDDDESVQYLVLKCDNDDAQTYTIINRTTGVKKKSILRPLLKRITDYKKAITPAPKFRNGMRIIGFTHPDKDEKVNGTIENYDIGTSSPIVNIKIDNSDERVMLLKDTIDGEIQKATLTFSVGDRVTWTYTPISGVDICDLSVGPVTLPQFPSLSKLVIQDSDGNELCRYCVNYALGGKTKGGPPGDIELRKQNQVITFLNVDTYRLFSNNLNPGDQLLIVDTQQKQYQGTLLSLNNKSRNPTLYIEVPNLDKDIDMDAVYRLTRHGIISHINQDGVCSIDSFVRDKDGRLIDTYYNIDSQYLTQYVPPKFESEEKLPAYTAGETVYISGVASQVEVVRQEADRIIYKDPTSQKQVDAPIDSVESTKILDVKEKDIVFVDPSVFIGTTETYPKGWWSDQDLGTIVKIEPNLTDECLDVEIKPTYPALGKTLMPPDNLRIVLCRKEGYEPPKLPNTSPYFTDFVNDSQIQSQPGAPLPDGFYNNHNFVASQGVNNLSPDNKKQLGINTFAHAGPRHTSLVAFKIQKRDKPGIKHKDNNNITLKLEYSSKDQPCKYDYPEFQNIFGRGKGSLRSNIYLTWCTDLCYGGKQLKTTQVGKYWRNNKWCYRAAVLGVNQGGGFKVRFIDMTPNGERRLKGVSNYKEMSIPNDKIISVRKPKMYFKRKIWGSTETTRPQYGGGKQTLCARKRHLTTTRSTAKHTSKTISTDRVQKSTSKLHATNKYRHHRTTPRTRHTRNTLGQVKARRTHRGMIGGHRRMNCVSRKRQ